MIRPIVIYGNSVLREHCIPIEHTYKNIDQIIENMWQTLQHADGCGLAASQINIPIQLFIVNSKDAYTYMSEKERSRYFQGDSGIKETFINAEITDYSIDKYWTANEGCLSIPNLWEPVTRPWSVTIKYLDHIFKEQIRTYHGQTARIIQHEFDHTQGKLYIDHLSSLRKMLIKNKLMKITKG